jgi:hypothetical protein
VDDGIRTTYQLLQAVGMIQIACNPSNGEIGWLSVA